MGLRPCRGDATVEKVKVTRLFLTLYRPWNSPGQNTGVGSHSILQGIFPTQGVNPGLSQCRRILYQLSHQGSPTVERRLIIKEDPYCSGRLLLWRGKIYNKRTLIPWGLLWRGRGYDNIENYYNIGTITIEGDHSVEGDYYRSSVQFSRSVVSDSLRPHEPQHARPPCPSPTPGVHPNTCPLSWWCHPTISSSVVPFSSCPQSFPTSGSFQMSQLFASGGQSIGVSASKSVLPMNTQDWSPSAWTGWTSLQSKGLSSVFSNTTVQKHQLFGTQLSLQSKSHIHTWPLGKP